MREDYHKWYSPILGRDFEMLVFGHGGIPVVLFPTSQGRYFEAKDRGLIDCASWFLENGYFKIYCPDSIDSLSWYNKGAAPWVRPANHSLYDQLIKEDVLGRAFYETGNYRAVMAGCSFGGYHAANFAFRHPDMVQAMLSMSGIFDMRDQLDGYYDDNVFYNNPVDYLPNDNDPNLWNMKIALGTGEWDICLGYNQQLSEILDRKNISHWLDVAPNEKHDWPVWLRQFPKYLSLI
ncbi:esterase [Rhizosphaericola mali]|uniref:Esterase n=1 Tax=Rhizosphaericola mali TaxID=2545455 RepID=A0A5P2G8M0_9BACT|nr:esterase [Rhizosphaericola mali]